MRGTKEVEPNLVEVTLHSMHTQRSSFFLVEPRHSFGSEGKLQSITDTSLYTHTSYRCWYGHKQLAATTATKDERLSHIDAKLIRTADHFNILLCGLPSLFTSAAFNATAMGGRSIGTEPPTSARSNLVRPRCSCAIESGCSPSSS